MITDESCVFKVWKFTQSYQKIKALILEAPDK